VVTAKGQEGVLVESFRPDGLAELAGVKVGDVLTQVNGIALTGQAQLNDTLKAIPDDALVEFTIASR